MKLRHLLTLLATGSLLSVASAQYLGSNDFSSGTGGGSQYSLPGNVGTFTVEQGRLEYSAASTNSSRVLPMNGGINTAYTEDWTASLTLSNLTGLPTSGFNLITMQVFSSNAEYGFFNIGLYRSSNGNLGVLYEKGTNSNNTIGGYLAPTSYLWSQSDLSDVLVRMSHNATTKDITLGYSLDGGTTYQSTFYFNPTGGSGANAGNWFAAPTDGYSFRILGRSSVDTIAGDLMFADNFSVIAGATAMTAIPEPSTYAVLAGLGALGLVIWRRRQTKTAA
jgi:PEP-CTERM motif